MNLVTVITPVAKAHRKFLARALESVATSTLSADVFVINDDESELSAEGVTIFNTGGKRGTACSRNLGIQQAQTPFVFFLDADDYLLNTGLEVLLRGYAEVEACYVYGDSYRLAGDGKSLEYRPAVPYQRLEQIRHALHLVSVLMPTALAQQNPFDEQYRGWEDFKYFIELGVKGYCGQRVPHPIIIYDLQTSLNRNLHNERNEQEGIYQQTQLEYAEYLKGEKELMPCGCNNRPAVQLPVTQLAQGIAFEFIAPMADRTIRMLDQTRYYARKGETIFVKAQHAAEVERRFGKLFRRTVQANVPTVVPTPSELNALGNGNRVARYVRKPEAELVAV